MVLNGIDFDQDWEGERGEGVSQNMAAIFKFIPRYIFFNNL